MGYFDDPGKLAMDASGLSTLQDLTGFGPDKEKDISPEILAEIRKMYGDLPLPELKAIALKGSTYAGDVKAPTIAAPERVKYDRITADLQGDTNLNDISVDPRLKAAQMRALEEMQGVADSGGMTLRDKANLSKIQSETSTADRGRREAILQNMQARGMGGSGAELIAQLQSSQAATDRSAQQGLDVAAMAQERALSAMMNSGQLGGNIRGQEFGEQAKVASAQDSIDSFNVGTRNQFKTNTADNNLRAGMFNSGAGTDVAKAQAGMNLSAATGNRDTRQGVNNTTAAASNQSTIYNAEIPQRNFDNSVTKINGQAGVMSTQAELSARAAAEEKKIKAAKQSAVVDGVAKVGAAGAGNTSDKRAKKNIKPLEGKEISDFLASIKPAKFEYKDIADGEGERAGVMAQDIEKTEMGKNIVVEDENGKKHLDNNKMMGAMMAALKHLSDKVG